jgi:hypothetical protein
MEDENGDEICLTNGIWYNKDGSINGTLTSLIHEKDEEEFEKTLKLLRFSRSIINNI